MRRTGRRLHAQEVGQDSRRGPCRSISSPDSGQEPAYGRQREFPRLRCRIRSNPFLIASAGLPHVVGQLCCAELLVELGCIESMKAHATCLVAIVSTASDLVTVVAGK